MKEFVTSTIWFFCVLLIAISCFIGYRVSYINAQLDISKVIAVEVNERTNVLNKEPTDLKRRYNVR